MVTGTRWLATGPGASPEGGAAGLAAQAGAIPEDKVCPPESERRGRRANWPARPGRSPPSRRIPLARRRSRPGTTEPKLQNPLSESVRAVFGGVLEVSVQTALLWLASAGGMYHRRYHRHDPVPPAGGRVHPSGAVGGGFTVSVLSLSVVLGWEQAQLCLAGRLGGVSSQTSPCRCPTATLPLSGPNRAQMGCGDRTWLGRSWAMRGPGHDRGIHMEAPEPKLQNPRPEAVRADLGVTVGVLSLAGPERD